MIKFNKDLLKKAYLNYYPILISYGKTITFDKQLIEDTIHDIFLKLSEKKKDLIIHSSLENYLLVALRNNLINSLKSSDPKIIQMDFNSMQREDNILMQEERVQKLINQLPHHQKEVLYLRYYKGKSYKEIAAILGITYQVARNFSCRAIRFLRDNIHLISTNSTAK